MSKEKENFKRLSAAISEEFKEFLKRLDSRKLESGGAQGEHIGNFLYTTINEPPYSITRISPTSGTSQEIFSLNDISELKKFSEKQRTAIATPIIRISDDESKIIAIVDTLTNDRPGLWIKDLSKNKIIVKIYIGLNSPWVQCGLD